MCDKTKFASIVPAMIQDKTSDWLLSKLDEQLSDFSEYVSQGGDAEKAVDGSLNAAAFCGRLIHEAFIAQYADEVSSEDTTAAPIIIEKAE